MVRRSRIHGRPGTGRSDEGDVRVCRRSERGAILVHVGIAIVALMGFSAMVFDYGVFWLARHQAQNAADAGALAGVISRVYDEPTAAGLLTSSSATTAAGAGLIIGD